MKGQFLAISAVLATLITLSLSASISEFQSQNYQTEQLPQTLNYIKTEIHKVTEDNDITTKEERNFREMLGYIENYEAQAEFQRGTKPCIQLTLKKPDSSIEMACIN